MSTTTLPQLVQFACLLNDARLDSTITDADYLAGLNTIQTCLDALGATWDDLNNYHPGK